MDAARGALRLGGKRMRFEQELRKLRISAVTQTDPRAHTLATWDYRRPALESEKSRNFRNSHVTRGLWDVKANPTVPRFTVYVLYSKLCRSKCELHVQGSSYAR